MQLLIDIGNTRAKLFSLENRDLTELPSCNHQQLPADIASILERQPYSQLWVASVADSAVLKALSKAIAPYATTLHEVVTPRSAFGLINAYAAAPQNLGVDRWLAMLGARQRCKRPFIVIDFGTAITVDLVDEFGQHKGGWIAPGYRTMTTALLRDTSQVTASSARANTSKLGFGLNTEECVSEGIRCALVGIYQQALITAQNSLCSNISVKVFCTGGDVLHLPKEVIIHAQICPQLVLEGLAVYANAEKSSDY